MAEMTSSGAVSDPPESISLDQTTRDIIRYGRRPNFSFPERQDEVYQGRIRFAVHKAQPLRVELGSNFDNGDMDLHYQVEAGFITRDEADRIRATETQKTQDAADSFLKGVSYKLHESAPIVDMYIPLAVTYNESVNYENANLGTVGSQGLAGAEGAGSLASGVVRSGFNAIAEGATNLYEFFNNINNPNALATEAGLMGALLASKPTMNAGIKNAVSLGVQRVHNPNTRSLFRNVNIRQFNFTFKMIPESPREALMVEQIVKHFRKELYPDILEAQREFPVAYKFPNAFSIQFNYAGQEAKLPRIQRCFLQGVDTSFNSTSGTFHADGNPTEIDLTLRFTEMRALNRKDVEEGL